ncbi:MAG: hypothetical protein HRK26_05100 [Rickettsiaceae bacterium H1]|nr:hypothetical protein [Rickettsiaceae bacterium H1]
MSDNDDFKKFSEQYLKSCKEQISALANNPSMLEKALEPFMKMQQEYLNNPESLSIPDNSNDTASNIESGKNEDNVNVMLQKILHRLQGIRKKALPEIANKIEKIDDRMSAIEQHLGIDNGQNYSSDLTKEKSEENEE